MNNSCAAHRVVFTGAGLLADPAHAHGESLPRFIILVKEAGAEVGALAPTVTGLMPQPIGNFSPALLLSAGLSAVSALIYLLLVRRPIQSDSPE